MTLELKGLIEKCILGDYLSQKHLYDSYSGKFFAICLRYSSSEAQAEDILQDAFVKIFNNLGQYKGDGSFEGWMRRIVINTAIESYRNQQKYSEYELDTHFDIASFEIPPQLDLEKLMKIIQDLPTGFRTVFNLFAIEGYTHTEIAKMLQISEGTSKSQLSRARQILMQKIRELYGGDL